MEIRDCEVFGKGNIHNFPILKKTLTSGTFGNLTQDKYKVKQSYGNQS